MSKTLVSIALWALGGWLLIEPWMLGFDDSLPLKSEKEFWDLLTKRFGAETSRRRRRTRPKPMRC